MIESQNDDFDAQTEALRQELMAVARERKQLEQERDDQAEQVTILESALSCAYQYAVYAIGIHDERQAEKSIEAIQRALTGARHAHQLADQGVMQAKARQSELREQLLQRWRVGDYGQKDIGN